MAKRLRYLNDPDPWMLAEDIPDMDPFFSQIWQSCFVNEFDRPCGVQYRKVLSVHRGYHLCFYYGEQDANRVGEHIAKRIVNTSGFAVRVNREIIRWSNRLRAFAERIPETRLSRLSNHALWRWYERHDSVHTDYYRWGWIPVAADMFHGNLTNHLKAYLRTLTTEDRVNEYLVALTQPRRKSLIQLEQEELLEIACRVYLDFHQRRLFREIYETFREREAAPLGLASHTPEYERLLEERVSQMQDRIKPSILNAVHQHYRQYFYVKHMWIGKDGVHTFDHYLKELVKLIGSGVNPVRELHRIKREYIVQKQRRRRLMEKLGIEARWRTVFDAWGDFMVTKIYRRFAQIYAVYRMQPILVEMSRRLRLSLIEVRMMLKDEMRGALLHKRISRTSLRRRTKLGVYFYERGREVVLTGVKATRLARQVERVTQPKSDELHGQVGCVGKAVGTVKIVIRPQDMAKMEKGDVLVSIATDPDIVPAMKKASAIVTEQGGVTSHAAIVSRELNIPCVIGTKIATKVLKDGDRVEVDATKGVVRKI